VVDFDVIGFGALNVDRLYRVNRIAATDEESFITSHTETCGGSAANTIFGLARLELKAGFIGRVADDREGQLLIDDFRSGGVDIEGVTIAVEGKSGTVIGFVDTRGERALYVYPGVNDEIGPEEVNSDYAEKAKLLHLSSFVGEQSFRSQRELVQQLPARVSVTLDPGMIYAQKGLAALKPIIQRSHAVLPNEAELQLLTGQGFEAGAERLIGLGARIVGVKLGLRGCYVTDGRARFHIPPYQAKAHDTTGAGDAWNTGFLFGLLTGKSLDHCGKLGNLVASKCIAYSGARREMPRRSDLAQLSAT
jgi:ribokinase